MRTAVPDDGLRLQGTGVDVTDRLKQAVRVLRLPWYARAEPAAAQVVSSDPAVPLTALTSAERTLQPRHHIDPGFINQRRCLSTLGPAFAAQAAELITARGHQLPPVLSDNYFVARALDWCRSAQVKPLRDVLAHPTVGTLFCSTELLRGTRDVYRKTRVQNEVLLGMRDMPKVVLEFGVAHFVADTGRLEQTQRRPVSVVGVVDRITRRRITLAPLIMGAPTLVHPDNADLGVDFFWRALEWYQIFPEDIDAFAQLTSVNPSADEWMTAMQAVPEARVKAAFAELLGDPTRSDWGGEDADHFSVSVTLAGRRCPAAFLLKGPAKFRPMTPAMLGKNGDQIHRLVSTPADLLVVQHCHDIGAAVRSQLRAYAVTPHNPRRYCLIDGKDTYRILRAYNKF